jgi:3-oxoacyl-[acyl-carrier protein] reductase
MPSLNDLDFSTKTVLVVGGSSGIGNGVAQAFRARGAIVYVWGTRATAADYDPLAGSNLEGLHYAQIDATDSAALVTYQPPFTRLDVLVTCQGSVAYGRKEFQIETFRKITEVNLMSVMSCCMKFHPMLAASKGSAVIFGSIAALHASRGNPAYVASKAAVHGLVMTLGESWARDGVRVNGVAPGLVDTKLTAVTMNNPVRRAEQIMRIPMGRAGTPADMAGPAMFLASDLAAFMTGQMLVVDGGRLLA